MIRKTELQQLLQRIDEQVSDNRFADLETLVYNIEEKVYKNAQEPPSEELKFLITQACAETFHACNSLCISHDAAVIKTILEYIRKSL